MSNNKDFVVKNAVEVGGATKVTVGDAATGGSYTVGYGLESASYDSIDSAALSTQIGQGQGIFFKPDGLKMYASDQSNAYQYSLSTAWDLSTISYDSKSLSLSSASDPNNIFFKSDGTKFYVVSKNDSYILEYDVSTAWDISTGSSGYSRRYLVSGQMSNPTGIFFKSDGTKMYVLSNGSDTVYQYSLSTAWDVTTSSYDSKSFSVTSQAPNPRSMQLNDDGTKMFVVGWSNDTVYEYALATAYDVSTASYSNYSLSVTSQAGFPYSMTFKSDGLKLYVFGATTDKVHQYSTGVSITTGSFDLSTGNYFTDTPSADVEYTFSNAGDVQSFQLEVTGNQSVVGYDLANASYDSVSFSVASQDTDPGGIFFKPDGTKMFISGKDFNDIYQYSLSTAWDLSTASYDSVSFDTSSEETSPQDLFFKDDGTIMYVIGTSYDGVSQYTLSTAWDISTASYASKQLSMSAQETSVSGLFIGNNGTKVYMVGNAGDDVNEYDLSTAWDISTGTYNQTYTLPAAHVNPEAISFNTDGTKMFVVSRTSWDVSSYTLSTAWDISTASHNSSEDFYVNSQDTIPQGLTFGNNGTKMYMTGRGSDTVYQYSTSTTNAITVTWDADIAWPSGTAPDSPANGEKDIYTFTTDDGGTTYIGVQSGDAFS